MSLEKPAVILKGVPQKLVLEVSGQGDSVFVKGLGSLPVKKGKAETWAVLPLTLEVQGDSGNQFLKVPVISGALSLLPPLIAIGCAFLFRNVLLALFLGVFSGILLLNRFNPFSSFLDVFNLYFIKVLSDESHLKVLLFTFLIAGFVGLVRKSGAMDDLMERLASLVKSPRGGMVSSWLAGLVVFFDDYANSLLLGNMLRPLTDKLRISREKLAYIVDSTAAPVASLAVSTWIGMQISLMQDTADSLQLGVTGMELFLRSWPYNFYSFFSLAFVLFIAWSDRDFGPMSRAERRARVHGKTVDEKAMPMQQDTSLSPEPGRNRAPYWTAGVAIAAMVLGIFAMLYYTGGRAAGFDAGFREIINQADTLTGLMAGPLVGIVVFWMLTPGLFTVEDRLHTLTLGAQSIFLAGVVLTLAWSIGSLCGDLETSSYIVHMLGSSVPAGLYPPLIFLVAGMIAFCTGTSWGTMAVLFPIAMPLVYHALGAAGMPDAAMHPFFHASLASVLTGSVLGDHISPISDTTLFSSMACGSDHMHHVKTQAPYALAVGSVALLLAYLPVALNGPWWLAWILGIGGCWGAVRFLGKKNPERA